MNKDINLQKRTGWTDDIQLLLAQVCHDYRLGAYSRHETVPIGYEDFNLVLYTDMDQYFIKVFASFRDLQNCQRYIGIIRQALKAGVKHPDLYESPQGYLYTTEMHDIPIRLCVMQYINGKSLYDLGDVTPLSMVPFFAQQAALINTIDLIPSEIYDTWAIINCLKEYAQTKEYLGEEDRELIEPLISKFVSLEVKSLPHCLVHGDIIKTNVLKSDDDKLHLVDFSVANYYPRIQELAVLLCNVLFDENAPDSFMRYYNAFLAEYQKHIKLDEREISALPTYVQIAHAMHVICPTYKKLANGNDTVENAYWLRIGKIGLRYTIKLWS